jgi:5-hydroxyisourate hydrolase-like protein (transthyretin family)
VADQMGNPIEGISIALVPLNGNEAYRIDTSSDAEGRFYAYVPVNSYTSWRVSIVGVRCGSRIADANCMVSNYFATKEQMEIVLPQLDPIEFVYQQATSYITGIVKTWQGDPAEDVRVFAVRTSDGARSWGSSQANGLFSLPAGDGVWEAYAALLSPYIEGEHVTITITAGQAPEQIELRRP